MISFTHEGERSMDTYEENNDSPQLKKHRFTQRKNAAPTLHTVKPRVKSRDLKELFPLMGEKNFHLPRDYWQAGCLFSGFSDQGWQKRTCGVFPVSLKTSHPLYVWKVDHDGETVCPCTSKKNRLGLVIPKGSVLDFTDHVTDKTSYVLAMLRFPLAPEENINEVLAFKGVYPPQKLRKPS